MNDYNFTLIRNKKHMIWRHDYSKKMITVSSSPTHFHKSALMRTLIVEDDKGAGQNIYG